MTPNLALASRRRLEAPERARTGNVRALKERAAAEGVLRAPTDQLGKCVVIGDDLGNRSATPLGHCSVLSPCVTPCFFAAVTEDEGEDEGEDANDDDGDDDGDDEDEDDDDDDDDADED